MRQTLLFSGLEAITYNQNRKSANLKLYEFGKSYHYNPAIKDEHNKLAAYTEIQHFSLFLTGRKNKESWYMANDAIDFFYLKSYVHNIIKRICKDMDQISTKAVKPGILAEGLIYFYDKTQIAEFGFVDRSILKQSDIRQDVLYADFIWDNLLKTAEGKIKYQEVPKFPEVKRDLALLIDKKIKFAQIEEIAFQTEKTLLKQIGLFDIYEGDKIDGNKKSYAVSFILQDDNKTLTDKEIDKIMARFIKAYRDKLGATLR
jgi:phenylalanyl-tRNA synthetase beta chain